MKGLPVCGTALLLLALPALAKLTLPDVIGDHMLLQRSKNTGVWGEAGPGEGVSVSIGGVSVQTAGGADGKWRVALDVSGLADGPFDMTVRCGTDERVVRDVLVGEVWVAGGQSNMEMPFGSDKAPFKVCGQVLGSDALFQKAIGKPIRVFRQRRQVPYEPADRCDGKWETPTRETLPTFSAVAFTFAFELNRALNVPVGYVDTTIGGTPVVFWTPEETLRKDPEDGKLIDDELRNVARQSKFREWLVKNKGLPPDLSSESAFEAFAQNGSGWEPVSFPGKVPRGVTWFRRTVAIPGVMRKDRFQLKGCDAKNLQLQYYYAGQIAERWPSLHTCLNTLPLSPTFKENSFPDGPVVFHMRVISYTDEGEILPGKLRFDMWDGQHTVPLEGAWERKTEVLFPPIDPATGVPEPFGQVTGRIAVGYNGMVHPFRNGTFRGIIWYQGHDDIYLWAKYERRMKALIQAWRRTFGNPEMPFYLSQISGYGGVPQKPSQDSNMAHLRALQWKIGQTVPSCGTVVSLDHAEEAVHARDKIPVGERLARMALAKTYGKEIVCEGPSFKACSVRDGAAVISFQGVSGGLRAEPVRTSYSAGPDAPDRPYLRTSPAGSQLEGFSIRGDDGRWHWASAVIEGDTVVVSHPAVSRPAAVRYAWGNLFFGNLYNGAGLPAVSFEAEVP